MNIILIIIQLIFLSLIVFGDIGFDKPGRYGLSFGHAIVFFFCYIAAFLFGVFYSVHYKDLKKIILQLVLPVLFFGILLINSSKHSDMTRVPPAAEETGK